MLRDKTCLVLQMKQGGTIPRGKHEAHLPHNWWYTSWNGGHQMPEDWFPDNYVYNDGVGYDSIEGNVMQWHCPGD